MQKKNRYLYYSILPFCLLLIAIAIYVSGYNPPTENPPFGNLDPPINTGTKPQTKAGDLTIEGDLTTKGILKLGQFNTADLPAGVEGALCFDTTKNAMQIYTSGSWKDLIVTKLGLGETCSSDGDCDLGHCVDGVCCNASCEGTCNHCNVAGSIGTCIEAPSDCTGCSICSSGNCIADPTKCTGNCVQCTGSGTNYSCSANDSLCTGDCSFCTGSDTEYNCAGSNGFCSNTISSCSCSGSGTVWNCQACGTCKNCSSYSCSSSMTTDWGAGTYGCAAGASSDPNRCFGGTCVNCAGWGNAGYCWYNGAINTSCTTVCSSHGGVYNGTCDWTNDPTNCSTCMHWYSSSTYCSDSPTGPAFISPVCYAHRDNNNDCAYSGGKNRQCACNN